MTFNRKHPIGQAVIDLLESECSSNGALSRSTSTLIYFLASFERIPLMFEASQKWHAEELIDAIRWNIGLMLRSFERFGEIHNEL
ncbi:MAG: hypothetical protein IPH09_16455 [bacterium]|nr:hypothetical protein [bacterium]